MNTEFPDLHSPTGFLKENRPSDTSCKVKNFSPPPFPPEVQCPSLNSQSIESIAIFKKAHVPLNNNEALCLSCTPAEHHEKATVK